VRVAQRALKQPAAARYATLRLLQHGERVAGGA